MSDKSAARGDDQADFGVVRDPTSSPRELHHAVGLFLMARWALDRRYIHPAYRMSWRKKFKLAYRLYRNTMQVRTGTSYKAHLAMAAKLLEIPPEVEGAVVECGCWLGGSTVNLSIICDLVGRDLIVYDSFEGLPPAEEGDKYATEATPGLLRGDLERV